jgi:hypothetical protein
MMNVAFKQLILVLLVTAVLSPDLHAQVKPQETQTKPPQLKLEVIPLKSIYRVGETVLVKYKLTSLVDGTLCFPPPAPEAHQSVTGYLTTEASSTTRDAAGNRFLEGFWEKDPTDEQLRSKVTNQWVKLGMSEPYEPKQAGKVTVLTEPGEWVIRSTYVPPALTTGQRVIVESLGCTPPDVEVHSAPVTITVMSASE